MRNSIACGGKKKFRSESHQCVLVFVCACMCVCVKDAHTMDIAEARRVCKWDE